MVHVGVYHFGNRRVACRNDYCTVCREPTFAEGYRTFLVGHVFWIPLLPLGFTTRWFCVVCKRLTDAKRPSRPGILWAGIAFGGLMVFSGLVLLIATGEIAGAAPMILLGAAVTGLLLWQLRSRNFKEYQEWKRLVPPLETDACPYCKQPLTRDQRGPRCERCDVTIATKN